MFFSSSGGTGSGGPPATGTGTFTQGLVTVQRPGGTWTSYNPTADTNTARGTALSAAVTAAVAGETVVVGPGTFALGGNRLALADNVDLAMDSNTLITSTADLATDGGIVYPGNNSIISGGTIQGVAVAGAGGHSGYQTPIGVVEDTGDSARTGVQVLNVTMIGDTDGFYIQHDTACSAVLRDCVIQTKWDAIMVSAGTTGAHVVDVYNPRIIITGPSAIPGLARGVTSDHQAVVRVFGGSISAADGGTTYTAALATINSGTLRAYNVKLAVSSSNTKYDVNNTSGTIELFNCAGSGSGGALQTNGTITYLANALGEMSFDDASDLTFGTSTGSKIGTSTGEKISFWGSTPVAQQVLATGTGKTVDNVITLLQTLGLAKQS